MGAPFPVCCQAAGAAFMGCPRGSWEHLTLLVLATGTVR